MEYRDLKASGEIAEHIAEIWRRESELPRWYQAASSCWTRTEESFREFVMGCWRVYGFYQEEDLAAIVYLEELGPGLINIHLSVLEKDLDVDRFIKLCAEIRDQLFAEGVTRIIGWVMQKNMALAKLIARIGFYQTGLRMDRGISRGTVLRWECMEVTT